MKRGWPHHCLGKSDAEVPAEWDRVNKGGIGSRLKGQVQLGHLEKAKEETIIVPGTLVRTWGTRPVATQ
jgi:hypothetical protein